VLPPYIKRLKDLPAPSFFAKHWGNHQQIDTDPVFNCMRPMSAVVRVQMRSRKESFDRLPKFFAPQDTSPALILEEFAEFQDRVENIQLDSVTCNTTMALIRDMSKSYKNPSSSSQASSGFEKRGGEKTRAQYFRDSLLKLMQALLGSDVVSTIEPSLVNNVSLL